MTSHRTGSGFAAALVAVGALLIGCLGSPATAVTSKGTVKGVVTLAGKPVSLARVQLYRDVGHDVEHPDFVRYKTANTDRSGRYTLSGLSLKKLPKESRGYRVVVSDRPGNIVKTIRTVTPKKGKTVTRNVGTHRAAILTGAVTRADGGDARALSVSVDSYDGFPDDNTPAFNPEHTTTVRTDGTFRLSGIDPDTYGNVRVGGKPYADQCYDFATNALGECNRGATASDITLVAGERRALPPVTATQLLPPDTRLSGKVTDTAGKALRGIEVQFLAVDPEPMEPNGTTVFTRSSGRFTYEGYLPTNSYTVRFNDPKKVWAAQYLGGEPGTSVGHPVLITSGQVVRRLDAKLKSISTTKIATKIGTGSAKVAFQITRKATGSAPSGTLTLSGGGISKTVSVTKGKATVSLSGLAKGTRSLTAVYSGTSSTAGFSKLVKVNVK